MIKNNYERQDKATIFLSIVLMLQVLRRANAIIYTLILLIAYLYWITSIKVNLNSKISITGLLFVIEYFLLPIVSIVTLPFNDFIIAMTRYAATLPFVIICIFYPKMIYRNIDKILKAFCTIVMISAILMIYQSIFGRISFFDSVNDRIGFERFGSLLGSTTTYGTVSLIAIIILYVLNPFNSFAQKIIESIIIVGGFLCLSKSFFVNLFISYVLILVYKLKLKKKFDIKKIFVNFLILIFFLCFIIVIVKYTFVGSYLTGMLDYSFSDNSTGVESSFIDRLTTLPNKAFRYYNLPLYSYLIYGVGFKGYGGTLGLPNYPMCHNNYFEIILAQELLYLILIIFFYIKIILKKSSKKLVEKDYINFSKLISIYFLINMTSGLWNNLTVFGTIFFCINFSILSVGDIYD